MKAGKKAFTGPVRLLPEIKETVWAGKSLSRELGLPKGGRAGEAWFTSRGARARGKGLFGEFIRKNAGAAMGPALARKYGGKFPVLVKIIEAARNLSLQVHPDDRTAKSEGLKSGKSETWVVLSAGRGAFIYLGLKKGVTPRGFIRAAGKGDPSGMVVRYRVRSGDVYDIPAGAVHALGAGVRVLEIQQDSDITYRIYDWGRAGRETHPGQALKCIRPALGKKMAPGRGRRKAGLTVTPLMSNRYYRIARVSAAGPVSYLFGKGGPAVFAVEKGRLTAGLSYGKSSVLFMPASAAGSVIRVDAGTSFYAVEAL